MKETLKKPKYKDMKLVKVAYGDDDDQKSFQETQGLIQAYPEPQGHHLADHGRRRRRRALPVDVAAEGQGQADRARLPEPDAQVRQGRHGRGVPAVGARRTSATSPARPPRRSSRAASPARRARSSRPAGSATTRSATNGEIVLGPLTDVQQGQHRRLRLLESRSDERSPARVGVFGIGLATYWPQFEGLQERIEGYQRRVEERVAALGGEVVSAGLVDSASRPPAPRATASRRAQVDLVLCHAVTYATSSTVLPVAQAAKAPVVLLGLQPTPTLDYANTDTGEWLANCAACCVPEIAGAFTRARIPYDTVAGTIDDDERAWAKIGALGPRRRRRPRAARRAHRLPRAHLSGHARPLLRLHRRARPGRRARRGARDRRPRRARGAGDRRGGRGQARGDPRDVRVRRPVGRPDRRADRATSSSTGPRASPSASTGSPPTSSSTR